MTVNQALALVAMLVAIPLTPAVAQFGGMPGMPGSPGGPGGGFGAPQAPPPACQQILALRDETQKNGQAIQRANDKKESVQVACKLFKTYVAVEARFLKALEDNSRNCGVPPEAIKQVKTGHVQALKVAKQVCDAAVARPAGPSLSDALGAGPSVPDGKTKGGSGAFDTLSGNALGR